MRALRRLRRTEHGHDAVCVHSNAFKNPPAPRCLHRDPWPAIQSLPALLQEFEGPGEPPQANSGKHAFMLRIPNRWHGMVHPAGPPDASWEPSAVHCTGTLLHCTAAPLYCPHAALRLQAWRCTGSFSAAAGTSGGPRAAPCAPTPAACSCGTLSTLWSRPSSAQREMLHLSFVLVCYLGQFVPQHALVKTIVRTA